MHQTMMESTTSNEVDEQQQPLIIPIQADSSSCQSEWTILELNGELIMPIELPDAANSHEQSVIFGPDQVELGSLRFQDGKIPVMILGSHELKGSIEQLKQPFCVFEKEHCLSSEGENQLQYKIAGVINKKLLFNNYPKSIMRS